MLTLSVIIITKDAEDDIRRCLESVKWADEIIVLDSGSRDNTVEICSEYTANVFSTDWPGFGIQKNRALAKAQGEWILSIDADEVLSDALRDKIKQIVNNPKVRKEAYAIKRVSYFCEKKINYGDWGHDNVVRLFRNQARIQFSPVIVHERLVGYSQLGYVKQVIFHHTIKNISQVLSKLEHYSTSGAQLAYQQHKKSSLFTAISHGLWCFIRGYFLRCGFLDGREGFIIAFSNALGVFYRYIKLIYLYKD
ncbi:MAG: glycosyltransferase family 2 protein [Pseudomonadota bacterium]